MQKVAEVERSQGGDLRAVVKVQIGTSSRNLSSPFERHLEAMRRDPTLRCSAGTVGACMKLRLVVAVLFKGMLLLVLCIVLNSCQSRQRTTSPAIEFTKIPPAAQGGRERVDTIAGRVAGARAGQQIVVYARSGPWWVQPWPDEPLIPIHADSTWGTSTHLGFEYAALLVEPGYHPPPTMDVGPSQGGSIVLVKIVKGVGETQFAPTKPLKFSGYDWKVRTIAGDRGGLNNLYDGDNAWTDASGALHLRIKKRAGKWSCVQMDLTRSLGYGTYIGAYINGQTILVDGGANLT